MSFHKQYYLLRQVKNQVALLLGTSKQIVQIDCLVNEERFKQVPTRGRENKTATNQVIECLHFRSFTELMVSLRFWQEEGESALVEVIVVA